jgi:hypothetical protein
VTTPQKVAICIYILLLLLCVGLLLFADRLGPTVQDTLIPTASEALKTVIGALIGAASMLMGRRGGVER